MSKGLDGLNFDDILSKVAGEGVDLGESKVAVPAIKEVAPLKDEKVEELEVVEAVPKVKEENKVTRKKKKRVSPKTKIDRNAKDYSCAKIKKRFIRLVRIVYPDGYVQEGIEKVFEEWERNNRKKIEEALKDL